MILKDGTVIPTGRPHKHAHPFTFLILFLPYGIVGGYLSVTLAFLFSKAGVSIEKVAVLVAAAYIPQMFKFLWAPLVDVTLTVKKWYILTTLLSALCLLATSIIPINEPNLPIMTFIIILTNFAVSFVGMAGNSLSAHDTPLHLKGRVSGYIQAGNMGGSGVGGGVGLWLTQHTPAIWISGAVLAWVCLACCFALYLVNEPASTVKVNKMKQTMANLFKDVWQSLKTKLGLLAFILCLMPVGTCAASNLFAAVAKDWHASADMVAMATGVVGGIITGLGSLCGGWLCDKLDRKLCSLLIGLVQGACAVGMAFLPHSPIMYITWTLLYAATAGFAYAAFNAYTLEAIGAGAAATKFEIDASVSNLPIYLMTLIEGIAYTRWGANGMLNTEAVCAVIGVALFLLIQVMVNGHKRAMKNALAGA